MTTKLARSGMAALVVAAGTAAAGVGTAEAQTSTADQGQELQGIESITVTARRVVENQQTVPVPMTTLSGAAIERDTVLDTQDLQFHAPSLQIDADATNGSAEPNFTIRGLSRVLGTDPPTVTYFAEVPQSSRGLADTLYDMEDVEVLRGPQGVAFGKNATGGAVVFRPQRPTDQFEGWIEGSWGNYGYQEYTGVVNLPVSDKIQLRLAGDLERRDGTTRNIAGPDLDDRDHESARLSIVVKPADWVDTYAVVDGYESNQSNVALKMVGAQSCGFTQTQFLACFFTPGAVLPTPVGLLPLWIPGQANLPAALAEANALGPRTVDIPFPQLADTDIYGISDVTTVRLGETEIGEVTLRNIVGYRHESDQTALDLSGAPIALLNIQNSDFISQVTEEFQVVGKSPDQRLDWLVGVFHSSMTDAEPTFSAQEFGYGGVSPPIAGLMYALTGVGPESSVGPNRLETESNAIYGQIKYGLGTLIPNAPGWLAGLHFNAGYRWTWDDDSIVSSEFTQLQIPFFPPHCIFLDPFGNPLPGTPAGSVDPATCTRTGSRSFEAPNWSIGIDDQITDNVMAYVLGSHGYKAGGLNFYAVLPEDQSFAPERVTNVEIGTKADWRLGGVPLRTNLSLFHEDYNNIQTQEIIVQGGTAQSVITNANRATIEGGELEVFSKPLPNLEVDGFWSVTQGTYDSFQVQGPTGPVNLSGVDIADISRSTYGATVVWHVPVAEGWGDPSLTADFYYRTRQLGNSATPALPFNTVPGFGVLNLRAEWQGIANRPVDLAVFVNNATDNLYKVAVSDQTAGLLYASALYGEPRLWGFQLKYRF
ncbi:MAG TPA: TonB-dependent receptor [Stellaceae bacterium]|nr:TonB-dependent receptor [Stellaceae bacterium]